MHGHWLVWFNMPLAGQTGSALSKLAAAAGEPVEPVWAIDLMQCH
jgi:hypothetical protein